MWGILVSMNEAVSTRLEPGAVTICELVGFFIYIYMHVCMRMCVCMRVYIYRNTYTFIAQPRVLETARNFMSYSRVSHQH